MRSVRQRCKSFVYVLEYGSTKQKYYLTYHVKLTDTLVNLYRKIMHLKSILFSRYASFYSSRQKSMKQWIRILANLGVNKLQPVLVHNMFNITQECNNNISSHFVKNKLHYLEISEENLWKVDFTKEFLNLRADNLVIPGFDAATNPKLFYIYFFYCTILI